MWREADDRAAPATRREGGKAAPPLGSRARRAKAGPGGTPTCPGNTKAAVSERAAGVRTFPGTSPGPVPRPLHPPPPTQAPPPLSRAPARAWGVQPRPVSRSPARGRGRSWDSGDTGPRPCGLRRCPRPSVSRRVPPGSQGGGARARGAEHTDLEVQRHLPRRRRRPAGRPVGTQRPRGGSRGGRRGSPSRPRGPCAARPSQPQPGLASAFEALEGRGWEGRGGATEAVHGAGPIGACPPGISTVPCAQVSTGVCWWVMTSNLCPLTQLPRPTRQPWTLTHKSSKGSLDP